MRNLAFTKPAFDEYNEWFVNSPQIIDRIKTMIREIDREPFKELVNLNLYKETGRAIGVDALAKNIVLFIKYPILKFLLQNAGDIINFHTPL